MVRGMGQKLKDYKRKTLMMLGIGALFMTAVAALIFWDVPRNKIEFIFFERAAIEQAARAYFQAEMEHNLQQVYAQLAPSSDLQTAAHLPGVSAGCRGFTGPNSNLPDSRYLPLPE